MKREEVEEDEDKKDEEGKDEEDGDEEEAEDEEKTYVVCTVILFHLVFHFYLSGSQVVHELQPDTK